VNTPFGEPRPIVELNSTMPETGIRLTSDELVAVFERDTVLYLARRASRSEPFGEQREITMSGTSAGAPWISDDELVLLFESEGDVSILRARTPGVFQGTGTNLVDGATDPYVVGGANGRIYVDNGGVLWSGTLTDWVANVDSYESLGIVGTRPVPTTDELVLYHGFSNEIWVATRASIAEPFGASSPVGVSASDGNGWPSYISPDRCRLYFDTFYDAVADLYVAERVP
jgi:hypothetical protein